MQTLILCGTQAEANSYIRVMGIKRGSWRVVRKAASIRGMRRAEIHILPGFLARRDRHPILSALRFTLGEIFYVDFRDGQIMTGYEDVPQRYALGLEPDLQVAGGVDDRAPVSDKLLEVAYRYNRLRDLPSDEIVATAYAEHEARGHALPQITDAEAARISAALADLDDDTAAPVKKTAERPQRRRRCGDCGELIEPADVESHKATHLSPKKSVAPADFFV